MGKTSFTSLGLKSTHAQFLTDGSTRDLNQVVVMGEVYDLGFCCQFAKRLEALGSTVVAVFDEKVVGDEGEGLGVLQLHLNGGETEGQEKLVSRAFAQPVEIHMFSVGAAAHELWRVAVVIDFKGSGTTTESR